MPNIITKLFTPSPRGGMGWGLLLFFLLAITCTLPTHAKHTQDRIKVLVLSEGGGQHGPFTRQAMQWLRQRQDSLGIAVTEINNTRPINKQYLSQFQLIIQLDYPPYNWTDEAMAAFQQYIDRGRGGWVGFHHATLLGDFDGFPMSEWFSHFMGDIRFRSYIAGLCDGALQVERPSHPVMEGVEETFWLEDDEWYTFHGNPRHSAEVEVLAHVDEYSYRPASDVRMGDHPAVWVNKAKRARNVYFLMGHSPKLFQSASFCRMLGNAIRWAAGQK